MPGIGVVLQRLGGRGTRRGRAARSASARARRVARCRRSFHSRPRRLSMSACSCGVIGAADCARSSSACACLRRARRVHARARRSRGVRRSAGCATTASRNASQASHGAPCARCPRMRSQRPVGVGGRGVDRAWQWGPFAMSHAETVGVGGSPSAGGHPRTSIARRFSARSGQCRQRSSARRRCGFASATCSSVAASPAATVDDRGGLRQLRDDLRRRRRERGRVERAGQLEVLAEILVAARVEFTMEFQRPGR